MKERQKRPRPPHELLATTGLATLFARVEIHKRLLFEVRAALPASLAEHCRECAVNEGHLVIYTDGQAWSFQLRFHASALLAHLKAKTGQSFLSMRARGLDHQGKHPPARRANRPSRETASMVEHFSRDAASEELLVSLSKLATTLRRLAEE